MGSCDSEHGKRSLGNLGRRTNVYDGMPTMPTTAVGLPSRRILSSAWSAPYRFSLSWLAAVGLFHAFVAPASAACVGDCNGDLAVNVDEVVLAVAIALGDRPASDCAAADADASSSVTVDEIVVGLRAALEGCPAASPSATVTPTATPTASATETPTSDIVPIGPELRTWLDERRYADWQAESAPHASLGPHFGRVRTFFNESLFASLEAGNGEHPQGSAVVKELYGNGAEVRGWSVMIKQAPTSDGGANWYWLEVFDTSIFADGPNAGICTGCHTSNFRGLTNRDLVLTPFPLQ